MGSHPVSERNILNTFACCGKPSGVGSGRHDCLLEPESRKLGIEDGSLQHVRCNEVALVVQPTDETDEERYLDG